MIRLSHKLPINSQKVADKSVSKLLKICHFIFKVAQKFIFFTCLHFKLVLLLSLPPGFVWIFLSLAILGFSGVARFAPSLLASAIGFDNRAFICTFFPGGIWITDSIGRHLEKRVMCSRWPHEQACNTKLALVVGPVLESTHSHSSLNQLNY